MMKADLREALKTLGDVLADRELAFELVAIGGGSLLLLGLIDRPTKDVDVIAIATAEGYESAKSLPPELEEAVKDVARMLDIHEDWLNSEPEDLLRLGLPAGFEGRTVRRSYGSLVLHLASRVDQVFFKLYAAVDQGPKSKHMADLRTLQPTPDELLEAARWARTHDPSDAFRSQLVQALEAFGVEQDDDD